MFKLLLRWVLWKEVASLLRALQEAGADKKLTNKEYDAIIKQLWRVGKVLRRET
jgi:hypothetical protein